MKRMLWIAGMTLAAAVMLVPAPREAGAGLATIRDLGSDAHPAAACCDKVDPDFDCWCNGKWHDNRCETTCSAI